MRTTERCRRKLYKCSECGKEGLRDTNHYGECYPYCHTCCKITVHKCLEPVPKDMGVPEPWKLVKLGDIVTIIEGAKLPLKQSSCRYF